MKIATLFLFLCCIVLTFSPAVRLHVWLADYRWEQWIGFLVWLLGFNLLYRQVNRFLSDRDPFLLPIMAILSGWGLLEVFRLDTGLGFRQTAWLAFCLIAIIIGLRIPQLLTILRRYKYVWLCSGLILALLTFFFGTYPGGSGPRLWLGAWGIYVQPSEFLKILLIIYLAAYLADSLPSRFRLIQLLTPTLILAGAALLILIAQKDLGTASLFIIIYTIIIYLASGKRRVLLFSFLAVIIAMVAGYLIFDVIRLRVEAWINPWLDPSGRSYQIVQSILAVANGGLFGRGLGLGSPGVVPVAQSDFIFAAITEEFGLAGAVAMVVILAVLTIRGFGIALHAPNKFQRFLAAGVTTYLITQSLLILGGTIRLLPLTGVTLPFISYGGSSLVTAFFSAFLLMVISNQSEDQPAAIENSRSYLFIGTIYLVGLVLVALVVGWWSMIRADNLLTRTDNPRRAISDRYVLRGEILDRNDTVLAESTSTSGDYQRQLLYPLLSATIGYSNPNYGQTGVEAAMDSYLRGVSGNQTTTVWINRELYGQYPPGLNIKLSLDLNLQKQADQLMLGKIGGLVVMNAHSGEILAMSTAPTFDANQLDAQWQNWITDTSAPLLNRVTLGQYPAGAATGAFVLARYLADKQLPASTPALTWIVGTSDEGSCATSPGKDPDWQDLISSGCSGALTKLTQNMTPAEILSLYSDLGFSSKTKIQVESIDTKSLPELTDLSQIFTGEDIRVSPLQMAIAASELTNGGQKITPTLVLAYQSPLGDWTLLPSAETSQSLANFDAKDTVASLLQGNSPVWQMISQVKDHNKTVTWYLAGTPSDWQGIPLTIVIALENDMPSEAERIAQSLLQDLFSN